MVYAALLLAYPKQLCVCLKVSICLIILYDIIFLEPSMLFQGDMWSCDCDCDITLTLILSPHNKNKRKEWETENNNS